MCKKIIYTKIRFGYELKKILEKTQDPCEIASWAFKKYLGFLINSDSEVRGIALALNTMEDGPEFVLSHEELEEIADNLIAGKEVNLYI